MKTAEEWHHTQPFIVAQKEANPNWKCNCVSCQHVRQIQLDAWRQGMSDAANICFNTEDKSGRVIGLDCKHNIEQVRNGKQTL